MIFDEYMWAFEKTIDILKNLRLDKCFKNALEINGYKKSFILLVFFIPKRGETFNT